MKGNQPVTSSVVGYYMLVDNTATTSANITPRVLSVDYAVSDRVYDGTDIATISSPATLVGVLDSDTGAVALGSDRDARFADRNVGENKTVTLGGLVLDGAAAGNYMLTDNTATTSASITPAKLLISTNPVIKGYNGTVNAEGNIIISADTLFGADSLSGGSFAFTDPTPGAGKTLLVDGVTVNDGNQGNNYVVNFKPNTDSIILPPPDPRPLDASWRMGAEQPAQYEGLLNVPSPVASETALSLMPTLYQALMQEFAGDLRGWEAQIDQQTLSVNFGAPEALFEVGEASIHADYRAILDDFFPRYLGVLMAYRQVVAGVSIEGHTSTEWRGASNAFENHARNMALSRARARLVRDYVLSLPQSSDEHDWLRSQVTDTGHSSLFPVLDGRGGTDAERSRRVSFRVITRDGV